VNEPARRPSRPKSRRSLLLPLFLAFALSVPTGFLAARMIRIPAVESLDTYQPNIITRLFDRNGKVYSEYAIQRRIVVSKPEIAPALHDAIVTTEDANFYKHGGVDPRAILRAAIKDIIARKKVEGASTLTQQLARQLYLTPEKSFRRKINEAFLAVEIEKNFTKDQIFEMYANQVYLGHGAYGVEAASRLYFGKHSKDLLPAEAALIAALIQRPEFYSPINHPGRVDGRRDHVLRRMRDLRYITDDELRSAIATPVVLGSFKEETPRVGAYFAEQVRQHIEKNYGAEDLYQKGLHVWTTLDVDMQLAAELALQRGLRRFDHRRGFRRPERNVVKEGLDPLAFRDSGWEREWDESRLYRAVVLEVGEADVTVKLGDESLELSPASWGWTRKKTMKGFLERGDVVFVRRENEVDPKQKDAPATTKWYLDQLPQVQGAIVVIDIKSGEVRALVGGYDFQISKFNRAVQSLRQVGSSFKPIVYGAAIEKGFTAADTVFDAPVAITVGNQVWAPRNYKGEYAGIVTLQRALEVSINIPAVKTWMMVGGANVIDFARRSGITAPLPNYPSLALGAGGVSPLEMTAAYAVLGNHGVHVKPRLINKIAEPAGKVLEEGFAELSEATSAQTAYILTWMMQATVDRGTAYAAHTLPGQYAGKTGTTNGFTDAWFIGYSPEVAVGVWVGYDDPARSLGGSATGADVALPIWTDFFRQMLEKEVLVPVEEFEQPPGIVLAPMDLRTGRLGRGPCGRVVMEAFVAGTEPDQDCTGSAVAASRLPFYLQKPMYQPKESEPVTEIEDATARPGEGSESPAPPPD
jgi:penicillin-binding protein 1A